MLVLIMMINSLIDDADRLDAVQIINTALGDLFRQSAACEGVDVETTNVSREFFSAFFARQEVRLLNRVEQHIMESL